MSKHQRPPEGTNVDEVHVVNLLPDIPSPCVSVRLGDGQVFLSRCQLEEMAEDAVLISKMWRINPEQVTEEQRLSMIYGKRVRDLLRAISDHSDASDYLSDESKLPREAGYLFSELLEDGAAAVVSLATGHTIPTIKVHYTGSRAGSTFGNGNIMFSFDNGSDRGFLLMIDWWVA